MPLKYFTNNDKHINIVNALKMHNKKKTEGKNISAIHLI